MEFGEKLIVQHNIDKHDTGTSEKVVNKMNFEMIRNLSIENDDEKSLFLHLLQLILIISIISSVLPLYSYFIVLMNMITLIPQQKFF
jgi:hypothetical protein